MASTKKNSSRAALRSSETSMEPSTHARNGRKQKKSKAMCQDDVVGIVKMADQVQLSISDFESGSMSSWSDLPASRTVSTLSESNSDSGIKVSEHDMQIYRRKLAGTKIYAMFITLAWRKRREECADLTFHVENLKKVIVRLQDRAYRIETYLVSEKKTNGNLVQQLREARELLKNARETEETLTVEGRKYQVAFEDLEEEFKVLSKQFEDQGLILEGVRKEHFQALTENNEGRQTICNLRRDIGEMETQKEELINEIFEINEEFAERERRLQMRMEGCEEFIQNLLNEINEYKKMGIELKESSSISEPSTYRVAYDRTVKANGPFDLDLHVEGPSRSSIVCPESLLGLISVTNKDRLARFERGLKAAWWKFSRSGFSVVLLLTFNLFASGPQPGVISFPDIYREYKALAQQ